MWPERESSLLVPLVCAAKNIFHFGGMVIRIMKRGVGWKNKSKKRASVA
jgi:hypothetical protein